jgi:tRNA modification GTPase
MVLQTLLRYGFRMAEPGEFTKRAFLNGKLDLTAAEGIRELVEAQSHHQWMAARQLASGRLAVEIERLRQSLIETYALVEAQVDFPDEGETGALAVEILDPKVLEVTSKIKALLETYKSGSIASQGLKVVLFGEPNAGKSTLLNTLLLQDRSLVTDIPGTTRDYLEERCLIEGRLVNLIDIAGIRESHDPVERLGVEKAKEWASKADLLLFLVPAQNQEHKTLVETWLREFKPPEFLKILTQSDLSNSADNPSPGWLKLSCHTGEGLDQLKSSIAAIVDRWTGPMTSESTFITNVRHKQALEESLLSLERYFVARKTRASIEILAHELKHALLNLQSIVGAVSVDDILSEIFGRFCIGK